LDKSAVPEIAPKVLRVGTESEAARAPGEWNATTPVIFGLKMDAMLPENMIKEIPPASRKDRSSVQPAAAVSTEPPHIDRTFRELTATQIAENEYRSGANLLNQGRIPEAQERFSAALQQAPGHVGARQALFGLLLQAKKTAEAEQVLQVALKLNPAQPGFAMAVARIQVDRGDTVAAVETLQSAVHVSQANPDYLAFLAALLQREGRHAQAIEYYQSALALAPRSGLWLMGAGISLQALGRNTDAREVYRRARTAEGLSGELLAFVDQRLKQLQ
jgi:MSHA biogenesis protein MshN